MMPHSPGPPPHLEALAVLLQAVAALAVAAALVAHGAVAGLLDLAREGLRSRPGARGALSKSVVFLRTRGLIRVN